MIPKEGVESPCFRQYLTKIGHVIPKEGVERFYNDSDSARTTSSAVIPKEGVESASATKEVAAAQQQVIPKEGVESFLNSERTDPRVVVR